MAASRHEEALGTLQVPRQELAARSELVILVAVDLLGWVPFHPIRCRMPLYTEGVAAAPLNQICQRLADEQKGQAQTAAAGFQWAI